MWTEVLGPLSLPTAGGRVQIYCFWKDENESSHIVLVIGELSGSGTPVRIQSTCAFGEIFLCLDCDCRFQLDRSLDLMFSSGCGVLVYTPQEGRGAGLRRKMTAMLLQQELHIDTVDAYGALGYETDSREYTDAVRILQYFSLNDIRLLTNSPRKYAAVVQAGIRAEVVPLCAPVTAQNREYLHSKAEKLGHWIDVR